MSLVLVLLTLVMISRSSHLIAYPIDFPELSVYDAAEIAHLPYGGVYSGWTMECDGRK